jgi:hypothetical protein
MHEDFRGIAIRLAVNDNQISGQRAQLHSIALNCAQPRTLSYSSNLSQWLLKARNWSESPSHHSMIVSFSFHLLFQWPSDL